MWIEIINRLSEPLVVVQDRFRIHMSLAIEAVVCWLREVLVIL